MKKIRLNNGMVALVDDGDFAYLSQFKWQTKPVKSRKRTTWYACRSEYLGKIPPTPTRTYPYKYRHIYMHREILGLADPKIQTDHRNGNGLDNQRNNIRACTPGQNKMNRPKYEYARRTSSRYKGVYLHKLSGKWMAYIDAEGKRRYLGLHRTQKAAHEARLSVLKEVHGDFAFQGAA